MASFQIKSDPNPSQKMQKGFLIGQAAVRTLGIAAALIAIGIMVTSKQTANIFGLDLDAKYSYSPAFKFFLAAYIIVCVLSLVSLALFVYCVRLENPGRKKYYLIFLIDLVVMIIALVGSAAATSIGDLGRHGNTHTGWMPICDHFPKFCNKVMGSLLSSYVAAFLFIILTAWSAWKSTTQASTY